MWPSVPLVVEEKRVGTAFGLMTAIQNLASALPLPEWQAPRRHRNLYRDPGHVRGSRRKWGSSFALLLLRSDRRHGNVLEQGKIHKKDLPRIEEGLEQR